ncbi:hypothetical protein [Luteolibacter soli]|uniref:IS66 family transposase n=1 Tax=Luteolibacter soli TaxID=3135280 RepID=A0ABU9B2S1_9BACT
MLPNDELANLLAVELEALPHANAERLAQILRGLFACMQDLNRRLSTLEEKQGFASRS